MTFSIPPLPWGYDGLAAKGISKEQVTFHYDKHHMGYVTKLNAVAACNAAVAAKSVEEIIRTEKGPIFNLAAQIFNHNFYWESISPNGGGEPSGKLADAIADSFGSFARFKEEFTNAAVGHFGSGWAWLVQDTTTKKLKVVQTHDAGCPLTEADLKPILACDVWEHAYYIDYKNDRPAYVQTFWNVVNWAHAEEQLLKS
ncbi:iron superoxide dismutase, putative [Trypanosoma brucei gambiense DAL972]|uniref:Superoxide dismutase n=1 Tax=Trypanosoma brucei gambiense (strain MHOM/CI/86/DAL972) TaxID=679716 RepID=D0AAG3_TRYB9|nr:iron superoxide dismutase, putative [Trypanosoma brucei gambiense DAL972]CBH18664.1 iron superoxide dismutase, putative [Trypanosoma brucei gambiense DAL972]|eukprot:XP_011780928.1 iron superoxide dismutase, putative [Trypanosoma brucei gambiense DAL972]